jgi:hypothetical protein
VVDEFFGLRAAHFDLAHVVDVEQSGYLACGLVLLEWAGGILNRHLPAGEWHHATAVIDVPLVKMGSFQIISHKILLFGWLILI